MESGLNKFSVKGSQFEQPLFEFSGACAGCGETPYVKLITQLFGDRMVIANATGCSSIYGGSAPTCPYTTNKDGHGPAWANSLFEDNAEFGFGINLAYLQRRNKVTDLLNQVLEIGTAKMKVAAKLWLDNKFDAEGSKKAAQAVKTEIIENARGKVRPIANELAKMEDCLVKKSVWISAATVGLTTSATADSTTCLQAAKT